MKSRVFGKKNGSIKKRLIAWLFRGADEVAQKAEKPVNDVEENAAVEYSTVPVNIEADMEVVPDENETGEKLENDVTEEMEFCDADQLAEAPPVTDTRYNENGFDQAGFTQQYYRKAVDSLLNRVCKAGKQMQEGNYEYAVFGAKTAAESAVKMLLCHNGFATGRMEEDIDDCRRYGLITDEMAGRLHRVRLLGNFNGHSFYAPDNLTHSQAFFGIMQTLDFLSELEIQLLWPEPLPELSAEWAREPLEIEEVLTANSEEERQ